jgi:uncharacterized surface protein with fasciclin (FAS1) repeats
MHTRTRRPTAVRPPRGDAPSAARATPTAVGATVTVRTALTILTALTMLTVLTGCSGSDATSAPTPGPTRSLAPAQPVDPALKSLVGPGCAAYAAQVPSGSGSIVGMGQDPLATAAGHNPLLKTLTAALSGKLNKKVDLVGTLNGGEWTVFAPVDAAFAAMKDSTVNRMRSNRKLLTDVLTYHVVQGRLSPAKVVGTQKSVQGGDLKVTGKDGVLKVDGANVVCGGLKTANGTLYLIDKVLTPPK